MSPRRPLTPIEALAALVERGEAPVPLLELVSRFGDVVQLFDEKEWLTRRPGSGLVRCRLCDEGHDARVDFDDSGHARYWCVASGEEASVDELELETRVVALESVPFSVRAALAPIKFSLREEIPGVLWQLGESTRCGLAWTAMFARAAHNENLALIVERLPRVSGKPGLVITSTATPPMLNAGGFRFRHIAAVMNLDVEGNFHVNDGAIRAGLGIERERRHGRGRPPDLEAQALAVIAVASVAELQCDDDQLLAFIRSRVPGLDTKSHGIIGAPFRKRIIDAANERCASLGSER
jgi:hypothetical protein